MQYLISFLEGIITFISPCLLPMLPIYISYFAGGTERGTHKTLVGAFAFVMGFTVVFVAMGALAGTLGSFLSKYQTAVNIVSGLVVIFFGLNFLGVFKLQLFKGIKGGFNTKNPGFVLGSALLLASQQGQVLVGMLMLLCYSLGLGIPFILSAVLIDKLKTAFNFIKSHYNVINIICGSLLVLIGVLMATGTIGRLLAVLS